MITPEDPAPADEEPSNIFYAVATVITLRSLNKGIKTFQTKIPRQVKKSLILLDGRWPSE